MKTLHAVLSMLVVIGLVAASPNPSREEEPMSLTITSTAFQHNGEMPSVFTCQGKDLSPPLHWQGVPDNIRSLVLIVDDLDAPDPKAPKMTWVHWVLYNLPPDSRGLPQGCTSADLPPGTREGLNDWKRTGYGGPCPPIGRHRYFFKFYALDQELEAMDRPDKAQVEAAMKGHIIAQAELVGTYQKTR